MLHRGLILLALLAFAGCAGDTAYDPPYDPLEDYVEVEASTLLDAPPAAAGRYAPDRADQVRRGEYLVELLGCGTCHTDGALVGAPVPARALAGSSVGIAWTNPLGEENPGVVYPSNITPDVETGIGSWSDVQIADAVRYGLGQHGARSNRVMPWPGYSRMTIDDVDAIVAYLRSIDPVEHRVPDEVQPGQPARKPFVYFGYYQRR